MFGTDLYVTMVLGVTLSLIFAEKTGISPAGIIVPGYLALVFDEPITMVIVFLISITTYIIVVFILSRFTILYGRRKFVAMLVVGICIKLTFDYFYPNMPFEIYEFRGIGVIVPGLMANTFQKNGIPFTIGSTVMLAGLTFGIINIYNMF